jgi:predicted kinase
MTGVGALTVVVGAAGAGKTTWVRQHHTPTEILTLDALREWVCDDPTDQDATGDAVEVARVVARARLRRGLRVVLDSTGTPATHRQEWAQLATEVGAVAVLVVVDTPLVVCLARNARRPGPAPGHRWGRRVPTPVVCTQHAEVRALLHAAGTGTGVAGYQTVHVWQATTGRLVTLPAVPAPHHVVHVEVEGAQP